MGTKVNIMDLEVDLLTRETLQKEILSYLDDDYLNIVHIISLDYMDAHDQDDIVRESLRQADLVLPGEKAILTRHHVDVLETGGMVVDYHSVHELVKDLGGEGITCYLVVRNQKEAKHIYKHLYNYMDMDQVLGVYVADGDVTEEALINDINTKLPDVIILSMDSTGQEEWLETNKTKLNAKLCVAVGSVLPIILRENVHVPSWIESIHLGGLYRRIARIPYSHFFRKRIFHRKLDNYNIKKKFRR